MVTSASGLCNDVNLHGDDIGTIKKCIETVIDPIKVFGLEVSTEETKYMSMFLFHHQNVGQNHFISVFIHPIRPVH
jgi:hypothetical protein